MLTVRRLLERLNKLPDEALDDALDLITTELDDIGTVTGVLCDETANTGIVLLEIRVRPGLVIIGD